MVSKVFLTRIDPKDATKGLKMNHSKETEIYIDCRNQAFLIIEVQQTGRDWVKNRPGSFRFHWPTYCTLQLCL